MTIRQFRLIPRWESIAILAAGAAASLITTHGLLDWRPVDLRRLTVVLREGLPVHGAVAMGAALVHSQVLDRRGVVLPGNTARPDATVLAGLTLGTAAPLVLGALMGSIPVAARAVRSPADAGDWLAVLAWVSSLVALTTLAHVASATIRRPYNLLLAPLLVTALAVAPVTANETVLNNTGWSTLLYSPTWGMNSPSGAWAYGPLAMAARAGIFVLTSLVALRVAAVLREQVISRGQRIIQAALWAAPVVVVCLATTLAQPHLMFPTHIQTRCQDAASAQACVFALDQPALPYMLRGVEMVTAQLPERVVGRFVVAPTGLPTGGQTVLLSTELPETPEQLRDETASAVAAHVSGMPACMARNAAQPAMSSAASAHTEASLQLQAVLLFRAGIGPVSTQKLGTVDTATFARWWKAHSDRIVRCELTSADLGLTR